MVLEGELRGKYVSLRSVAAADAADTARLRGDEELTRHIHRVDTTLEGQKKYIEWQRQQPGDYYFSIRGAEEGQFLGTIALYHFDGSMAELGRWISRGNAFQNLEAVILVHDFAFEHLGLEAVCTCTNVTNERVIGFWRRFGSDRLYIEEQADFTASKNIVTRETYAGAIRPRMEKMLRY